MVMCLLKNLPLRGLIHRSVTKSTKRMILLVLIQYTHHVNKQSISGGLLKRQDRCNDKKGY